MTKSLKMIVGLTLKLAFDKVVEEDDGNDRVLEFSQDGFEKI